MSLKKVFDSFQEGVISKPDYIKSMHDIHKYLFEYSEYIKNKDIQKIEIMDDVVIITSREKGIKIICDPQDHRIAPMEILNFNEYEREDSDMIHKIVKEGDCVFDIGANIGWYSISLTKSVDNINVHAFEPIPKTYEYLISNTKLNGCSNIKIYNHGLSNVEQDIEFYYYPEGSGNASMQKLNDSVKNVKITSKVYKLDDFVNDKKLTKLDFIKCDVEGAEFLVFQGAENVLRKMRPIVFSELLRKWSAKYDYHPNDMLDYFRSLDYSCYTVKGDKLVPFGKVDDCTEETNYFLVPNEKCTYLQQICIL